MKVIQSGLDFYRALPLTFLVTYPIRRPTQSHVTRYSAIMIEEQRARSWFEGWCAERGITPEVTQ